MAHDILMGIVEIFGIFAIGWIARWRGYIREADLERWSRFVIDILFPLLVFEKIIQGLQADQLVQLWPLPAIGLGMIVVGAAAGFVLRKGLKSRSRDLGNTFHHFCAMNNYAFLPIIIIDRLWGDAAVARLFLLNLGSTIGLWTVGIALLGQFELAKALRKILTPSLIALFIALALSMTGLSAHIPEVALNISQKAGAACVPCMLILVGASLFPLPSLADKRDLAYLVVVRLVLLPVLLVAVLWVLPIATEVRDVGIIVALMPASASATLLTRRYGGDPSFAVRAALVTTIFAAVTAPVSLWLLLRMGL